MIIQNLTTLDNVKAFWPFYQDQFNGLTTEQIDAQLVFYMSRADFLINALGQLSYNSEDNITALTLGANMLVKRLVLADSHPGIVSDAVGLLSESAQGLSWSSGRIRSQRDVRGVIGDEIYAIVNGTISGASLINMQSQQVFAPPIIHTKDASGNDISVFDPRVDDSLQLTLSERLGLRIPGSRDGALRRRW